MINLRYFGLLVLRQRTMFQKFICLQIETSDEGVTGPYVGISSLL